MPSRGDRNNNPGNLKASSWTASMPGYVGKDSGGFAIFDTWENGVQAQLHLLGNYYNRGLTSIRDIISKYSPDQNLSSYIATVSKKLGVGANSTLPKSALPALGAAMRGVETGHPDTGNASGIGTTISDAGSAVANALTPSWLQDLLSGHTAARWTAVVIGIVLIGLAIAAFVLTRGDDVKAAVVKATL